MSSSNTSSRPAGCITIPVEIVSSSNSNSYTKPNSSFRPYTNENSYSDFSNSPPWKKPSTTSNMTGRFQPRHSPIPAYERLIQNSEFNQPLYDRPLYRDPQYHSSQQRTYESRPLHTSRSSDDLLSTPSNSMPSNTQSRNTSFYSPVYNNGFRSDSDFIESKTNINPIRRSNDALNDFPDAYQKFPINRPYPSEQEQSYYRPSFVNSNEYRVPTNHQQTNTTQRVINNSHDRSHSPVSQHDESPVRPPPPASQQQQQQQESDFKMSQDSTNTIPKSGTTATSSQSNDQQVPFADTPPVRDPNIIALEKLEQIKQNLADLNQQVDVFTGLTRNDRTYKELDEQALKMMMRCDELIDVSADIKEKRKEMIRNVQTVLAKLECKVPINSLPLNEQNSNQMETTLVDDDSSINNIETQKEDTLT